MASFEDNIINGVWIGKEILKVPEWIRNALSNPSDWFVSLPIVRSLIELSTTIRESFNQVDEGVEGGVDNLIQNNTLLNKLKNSLKLGEIIKSVIGAFGETAYGINKAFNSKQHSNLQFTGERILGRLLVTDDEVRIYRKTAEATNYEMKKIGNDLIELEGRIESAMEGARDAASQIIEWEQEARSNLLRMKAQVEATIESATGKIKSKAKRLKKKIDDVLLRIGEQRDVELIIPQQRAIILAPSVAIGVASIGSIIGMVNSIATMFLSSFSLLGLTAIQLSAISFTVTSTALKTLSSVGAEPCRYFAAAKLREVVRSLPKLFAHTGMGARAWGFIGAWSLPIIIAAIIIVVIIKNKLDQVVGEEIFIFGQTANNTSFPINADILYAKIQPSGILDIREYFEIQCKKFLNETGKSYENIYGFNLKDNEIISSFRINNLEAEKISNSFFAPFAIYTDDNYPWF